MSDSEAYLRELRRALPIWCRRRLLAEVREHFALAVAAEAARGVPTVDAEQMTIRRLGPARALADQLLDDLRSGALGRVGRFAVTLTATRLAAFATVAAIAVVLGVGLGVPRSSSQPPALQRPGGLRGSSRPSTDGKEGDRGSSQSKSGRAGVPRSLDIPSNHANRVPILMTVAKPGEIQVASGVWRPARLSH